MNRARGVDEIVPRSIDDAPIEDFELDDVAGYLMPEPRNDPEFTFNGDPADYPEEWQEQTPSGLHLRSDKRKFAPRPLFVEANGLAGATGRKSWFIRGKFRFSASPAATIPRGTGPRIQQAREPFCWGRACDNASRFECGSMDEQGGRKCPNVEA